MFNKAATDLETKGVINLKKYTKYLTEKNSELVWTLSDKEILLMIGY